MLFRLFCNLVMLCLSRSASSLCSQYLRIRHFDLSNSCIRAIDSRQLRFIGGSYVRIPSDSLESSHRQDSQQEEENIGRSFADIDFRPRRGYGPYLNLTQDEKDLFRLLRRAREETSLNTTLRVAGGWVRDKLLATPEFSEGSIDIPDGRLTSKYKGTSTTSGPSMGRLGTKILSSAKSVPVDIDIALDDMLGREFADHLNEYLTQVGEDAISVGVVLKNPEKSKHLETATMKVGRFWIDFVNLRAEEYTQDSRIPDLMRIGTPAEDAFRRDLTINALFYNINNGQVEDWTGRGFDDLRRGVVATPLAPLTTLLDDPLRTLRSVRFAARLRFTMDDALREAAMDSRVRSALSEKVSRERIGGEVDLMLRSPDPVGAMRLLVTLDLAPTVFPIEESLDKNGNHMDIFASGLELLSTCHDRLWECQEDPPTWCATGHEFATYGVEERTLMQDKNARRLLWYASFLKPFYNVVDGKMTSEKKGARQGKKANRSHLSKLLIDDLKRPIRDSEAIEKIIKASDDIASLIDQGGDLSAISIILSGVRVEHVRDGSTRTGSDLVANAQEMELSSQIRCFMNGVVVYSASEDDPVWDHAMQFRLECARIIKQIGGLWRAALFLAQSEQLQILRSRTDSIEYAIEGDTVDESIEERRLGIIQQYDAFAVALQRLGLIGIWEEKPLIDGKSMKKVLPGIPKGPAFRSVMDEQEKWMTLHPGASPYLLTQHLINHFSEYA